MWVPNTATPQTRPKLRDLLDDALNVKTNSPSNMNRMSDQPTVYRNSERIGGVGIS